MKNTLKIMAISALATAAVIKAAPVLAEPVTDQNISIVQTSDLDLTTAAGRSTLEHRLVTAAYEVCGSPSDADLVGRNQAIACRVNVLAQARAQSEQLAGLHSPIRLAAAR